MTETPNPEPEPLSAGPRDAHPDREEADPVRVPLRAGGAAELALVRLMLTELRLLQHQAPDQFAVLAALGRGAAPAQPVSPVLCADGYFVEPDGALKPLARAVLASALRDTPEGPVLREPVDRSDARVRAAYQEHDRRAARNLGRVLRRGGDAPPDGPEGVGR